jgi:hypothetical protein
MKKIYLIEELLTDNGKLIGFNAQYEIVGFVTNKVKAQEIIKTGKPIEKLDMFGRSYIPKQIVNQYKMREVNSFNEFKRSYRNKT